MAQPQEAPAEAVIEFGSAETAEASPRRRFLAELGRDRRVVPLTAGLGALALFASLISEWQVTSFDSRVLMDGATGSRPFAAGVGEVGGWGTGCLAGVFLLVPVMVVMLFGPAAGRAQARLAALGLGGTLLAVVAAAGSALGETSWVIGQLETVAFDGPEMTIALGRGVWCAAAGTILMLVSAWLAGRQVPAQPEAAPAVAAEPGVAAEPAWSWRRHRAAGPDEEERPEAPFELEVSAAKPWQTGDTRDGGISG